MTDPSTGNRFQLRAGTTKVVRPHGTLLVATDTGRALRVSNGTEAILPMLAAGATFAELQDRLTGSKPSAVDTNAKLALFLESLRILGFLVTSTSGMRLKTKHKRLELIDLDPHAKKVASILRSMPHTMLSGIVVVLVGAAAGILSLFAFPGIVQANLASLDSVDVALVAALMLGVVIPLHEFSHAVACRTTGIRVGKAGLMLVNGLVPAAYVDTSFAYMLGSEWRRASIAAAGPLIDLVFAGASAWLAVSEESASPVATLLLATTSVSFLLALNPFATSDGSRIIEAFLNDELARTSALSTTRAALSTVRSVVLYRLACLLYLACIGGLVWAAWSYVA